MNIHKIMFYCCLLWRSNCLGFRPSMRFSSWRRRCHQTSHLFSTTTNRTTAMGAVGRTTQDEDKDDDDDWISQLPANYGSSPRRLSSTFLKFQEDPSFQAFCAGSSSFCTIQDALDASILQQIQADAKSLQAMGFGATANVVQGPKNYNNNSSDKTASMTMMIRHGVTQLWLQTPPSKEGQSTSSSPILPNILAGHFEARQQLREWVEGLRQTLTSHRDLPPEYLELSYLWYNAKVQAHYDVHVDVPTTPSAHSQSQHRRRRSVSFLLYLGDLYSDRVWDCATDGGQLRVFLEDDDHPLDIPPSPGTLVVFDAATVPHQVVPTHRNRAAVVGWFGTSSSNH